MASGYKKTPLTDEQLVDKKKVLAALTETADEGIRVARQIAPVGTRVHETKGGYVNKPGDYKRGLKTTVRRGRVYMSATDWKSHWIEFGSVNNTPSAPLRRGAQAVGKLRESDRR